MQKYQNSSQDQGQMSPKCNQFY